MIYNKSYTEQWFSIPQNRAIASSIVVLLWLLVQYTLATKIGIVTSGDAVKYLRESDNITNGRPYSNNQYILYSTYIIFLAILKLLGMKTILMYLVQTAISGVASIYFFKLSLLVSKNFAKSYASLVLFVCCVPLQKWNVYFFTESLFTSILIAFYYNYFKFGIKNKSVILFLTLALFARPTGILLLPTILIHQIYLYLGTIHDHKKTPLLYSCLACIGLTCIFVLIHIFNKALSIGGSFDFSKPLVEAHVICDVPVMLSSKAPLLVSSNPNSLQGLIYFALHNMSYFSILALRKTYSLFIMTRHYYSSVHNIYLYVYCTILYAGITFNSIRNKFKTGAVGFFSISMTLMVLGSVVFTCDDWHGRFIIPVLPLFILNTITTRRVTSQ